MKRKISFLKSVNRNVHAVGFLIALFALATSKGLAQSPPKDMLNSIIPPSPNAASLGKYGEVPVSLYTGLANINIPIYELKGDGISLPISLSYHPSGIRLDEEASWVGLGWTLNAGGVITRAVAGVNDDDPNYGYLNTPAIPAKFLDYAPITGQEATTHGGYLMDATENRRDFEPDVYYYNFNGYSGKFVFDANRVPQTIPASDLRIEVNPQETPLLNFTIVTAEGVRYKFGGTGYVEDSEPEYIKYTDQYGFMTSSKLHQKYNSAWYLAEIRTPDGEIISFTYTPESITTESNYSQTRFIDFNSAILTQFSNNSTIKNKIGGLKLNKINFKTSEIEFYGTAVRQDLVTLNAKVLEKIIIRQNGVVLSNFLLNTSYFQSTGSNHLSKRLKLNSVQEFSADLSKSKPPYVFTYDETPMPPRNSFAQDHWGYYNGKTNNTVLIPGINSKQKEIRKTVALFDSQSGKYLLQDVAMTNYVQPGDKTKIISFPGADREPRFPEMRAFSLIKVVYPTGGYTNYTYEPHDFKLPAPIYVFKELVKEVVANSFTQNVHAMNVNLAQEVQNIPNADLSKPYYAKVEVGFSALPYMDQLKLCATVKPEIYLQDVTTGVNIVFFKAQGVTPAPTVNAAAGTEYTVETLGNNWIIQDVKLDPTHTYKLYAEMYPCDQLPPDAYYSSLKMTLAVPTTQVQAYNGLGGGLRIRMIESGGDGSTYLIKKFVYKKFGEVNPISSGELGQAPVYMELNQTVNVSPLSKTYSTLTTAFKKASDNNLFNATATYTSVMALYSGSRYVLGQTSGSAVGYAEVQEWICDNVNATVAAGGKTIHKFTTFNENPDVNPTLLGLCLTGGFDPFVSKADPASLNTLRQYPPFASPTSYDYKRGLLTTQEYRNSADVVIKKVNYVYNPVTESNNLKQINGLKVVNLTQRGDGGYDLLYARYIHRAAWNYLREKVEITYNTSGTNPSTVTTSYEYSNPAHMQLTGTSTILENAGTGTQRKLYTKTYYPLDYTFPATLSAPAAALKSMAVDKHIWSTPVEQLNYTVIGSTQRVTGGGLSTFKMNGTMVAKDKDFSLKFLTSTIYKDLITVTPSVVNSSGQFIYDSDYELLNAYTRYDGGNNILEVTDRQDTSAMITQPQTGDVWAAATNTRYTGIAYTSFEHTSTLTSGFTNWNYNVANINTSNYRSGTRAYNLSGANITTTQTLTSSQKYKVSLWRKVGSGTTLTLTAGSALTQVLGPQRNGWQYIEATFTGATSLTISGNYIIDELRLCPVNARMTTYVYKDGVGITSQCNENNQHTFFEYDEFNRLKLVKDQDGNILKKNEYKYQHIQN